MKKWKYIYPGTVLLMFLLTTASANSSMIKGKWIWILQQSNCMETYIFGDGIVEGKSGTQRFEGTFVLAPEINNYGLYILSLEITSYPGIGCGSEVVETQSRYSSQKLYVRFSNIGDTMVIYYDAVGTSGFGPLERNVR